MYCFLSLSVWVVLTAAATSVSFVFPPSSREPINSALSRKFPFSESSNLDGPLKVYTVQTLHSCHSSFSSLVFDVVISAKMVGFQLHPTDRARVAEEPRLRRLICALCKHLAREPWASPTCNHRFCCSCLEDTLKNLQNGWVLRRYIGGNKNVLRISFVWDELSRPGRIKMYWEVHVRTGRLHPASWSLST